MLCNLVESEEGKSTIKGEVEKVNDMILGQ